MSGKNSKKSGNFEMDDKWQILDHSDQADQTRCCFLLIQKLVALLVDLLAKIKHVFGNTYGSIKSREDDA